MDPSGASLWNLLWSDALATRAALVSLWLLTLAGVAAIHGPLLVRLRRLRVLRQALAGVHADTTEDLRTRRDAMSRVFGDSPLAIEWDEFVRRWRATRDAIPQALRDREDQPRAAVRLRDVLADHPLWPPGPRTQLVAAWPLVALGLGALAAVVGANAGADWRGTLPGAFSGLALALILGLAQRVMRGHFDYEAERIDRLAGRAYAALSATELTAQTAVVQSESLDRLRADMTRAARERRPVRASRSTAPTPLTPTPDPAPATPGASAASPDPGKPAADGVAAILAQLQESGGGAARQPSPERPRPPAAGDDARWTPWRLGEDVAAPRATARAGGAVSSLLGPSNAVATTPVRIQEDAPAAVPPPALEPELESAAAPAAAPEASAPSPSASGEPVVSVDGPITYRQRFRGSSER